MSANGQCGCGLAACGCCAGVESLTPKPIENRPGLSALTVRVGRHGDFLASMLARLSSHAFADGGRPLAALRTRDPNDPAIALLDAFAAAGDVLAFYNERIANEGYLRTALEFRSVEELARLVGYAPDPGVAASVFLAFGIDPNTIGPVDIARGTRVQSVPGQDELPQSFETSDPLVARAAWNRIGLRMSEPQRLVGGRDAPPRIRLSATDVLYLASTTTRLKVGDALLLQFAPGEGPVPRRVIDVVADVAADHTRVELEPWLQPKINDSQLAALIWQGARFGGDSAPAVIARASLLQHTPRAQAEWPVHPLLQEINERTALLSGPAHDQLRAWLASVSNRAAELLRDRGQPAPPSPPVSPARPSASFADRLKRLAAPPAAPLASAAELEPSTAASFAANSAAALQVVASASPAAAPALADAMAGHTPAAAEQRLRVYAMRLRAGLFGRGFPKRSGSLSDQGANMPIEIGEWPIVDFGLRGERDTRKEAADLITLDTVYDGIMPGSWIMVDMEGIVRMDDDTELRVGPVDELLITQAHRIEPRRARADYGGSGDSTALHLPNGAPWIKFARGPTPGGGDIPTNFNTAVPLDPIFDPRLQAIIDREFQLIRRTIVYAQPEELALAERPITRDFCVQDGEPIELDGLYADLEPGRYVIVSGERADIPDTEGVFASELAMIAGITHDVRRARLSVNAEIVWPGDRMHSFVTFANDLSYCYRRDTVVIHGNVVKATHGETRAEPLGNGDAAKPNASFALKQAPLTYLPAPTARGAAPALEVFVDDIRWHLVETLVDGAPTDRAYILRGGEGGKAEIQFGDGREGARPTTGIQNLRAVYRTGIGRPGNARAGQISQLASRPLGLRDVVNPLPATGGADAESLDQLRRNAPLATMALERIVSVRDHSDFARTFAGIAKADARLLTDGARRLVHLTVAAEDDAPLDATSDLVIALRQALARLGDPFSPALVAPRELRLLIVAATIRIDPDRVWEKVVAEVRADLLDRFGFDRRDLAQGIAASALVAAIQRTPGVAHVDLDTFGGIPTMTGAPGERAPLPPEEIEDEIETIADKVLHWATAKPARFEAGGFLPAELLMLSPDVPATLILNRRD